MLRLLFGASYGWRVLAEYRSIKEAHSNDERFSRSSRYMPNIDIVNVKLSNSFGESCTWDEVSCDKNVSNESGVLQ